MQHRACSPLGPTTWGASRARPRPGAACTAPGRLGSHGRHTPGCRQGAGASGRDAPSGARAPRPRGRRAAQARSGLPSTGGRAPGAGAQDVEAARREPQHLAGQRAQVTQRRRASGHAYYFVALERGVRRTGTRIASDIQEHSATLRTLAQQAQLSATCLDRRANAARVGPTMPAPIACVSGAGRQQVRQRDLVPLVSYAMHAPRIPLRGLDHPSKRACLTTVHNFFLTRPDGTPAAERFVGQKPRSMFVAILGAVEIPPAPLSPPRRAVG